MADMDTLVWVAADMALRYGLQPTMTKPLWSKFGNTLLVLSKKAPQRASFFYLNVNSYL